MTNTMNTTLTESNFISNDLVTAYESKVWENFSEPKAADYFITNNPILICLILVVHLYLVNKFSKNIQSSNERQSESAQLRPFLIVLNGINFGAYGCGLLVIGYFIDYGLESWKCKKEISENSFKYEVFLRIGYVLFLMRLLELLTPLIMAVRGKKNQKPLPLALYNACYLLCLYHVLNRYPKEVMYLFPFTDGAKTALRSAYYSLKSPGPSFGRFEGLRNFVLYSSLLLSLYTCYHAATMMIRNCEGPKVLMAAFFVLASMESFFMASDIIYPQAKNRKPAKNQKQI